MKTLEPPAAIITGITMIGFGLYCHTIGIFPVVNPGTGLVSLVKAAYDLMRFIFAVFITIIAGLTCVIRGSIVTIFPFHFASNNCQNERMSFGLTSLVL